MFHTFQNEINIFIVPVALYICCVRVCVCVVYTTFASKSTRAHIKSGIFIERNDIRQCVRVHVHSAKRSKSRVSLVFA